MAGFIDELVPEGTGDRLIKLELRRPFEILRAFSPIELSVTVLSAATDAGIAVPLELTIMSPNKQFFRRILYQRVVPSVVAFTPQEGGRHLIRLAETAHNSWWGAITLPIEGARST
jgi:hypothetical protein